MPWLEESSCERHPAVALLGPRQSGKTTLALEIAKGWTGPDRPPVYLDLELPSDLAKLSEPELYLSTLEDRLVILDEVQRLPGLFMTLRGLIRHRQAPGTWHRALSCLLGSASIDLIKQSAKSLASRIVYSELTPFDTAEVVHNPSDLDRHSAFGPRRFPRQFYLAASDAASAEWRTAFIRTYLERDTPQLGGRMPAETLRRFWTMLSQAEAACARTQRSLPRALR